MKVAVFGRATTFKEAQAGGLIRIAIEKTEYLGVKVFSPGQTALLLLQPGLTQFWGKPAIISGDFDSFRVCEVTDTEIRASYDHLELVPPITCEPGDLALAEGLTFICVHVHSEQGYVNTHTGEYAGSLLNVPMAIKQWSIVRVVDGKATPPIFRWPAAS
jgi:hypothetical protein